jgi:hypothetical protein
MASSDRTSQRLASHKQFLDKELKRFLTLIELDRAALHQLWWCKFGFLIRVGQTAKEIHQSSKG